MVKDEKFFSNCLRMQITNDDLSDERIDELVEHCVKYRFDNVMLMINAEEFNVGHISVEEAKPWVEVLKKAKVKLEEAGISVSVNNWIEIGHLDRGRKLKPDQAFNTMVDFNGKKSEFVACPLDKEWLKYFTEYARFLTEELKPEVFWIEDDFRLHNHDPLEWGGCFCEEHIKLFNKKLGKNYTREEFVKRAFKKGKPTIERKVWLDSSRETMNALAEELAKTITSACPQTEIGLMSSTPGAHCMEGRKWDKLLGIFSGGKSKINRIHLPGYFESSGKEYLLNFNSISMGVRAFCSDDTVVMPEMENGSATVYRKNEKFMKFELEAAAPLLVGGMTYSIYDFVGNGAVEGMGYGKVAKQIIPYLQAIKDLNLKFSDGKGVVVPVDEEVCYRKEINDFYDLGTNQFYPAAYLSGLGINYKYSTSKKFENKTVALFADGVYNFSNEELKELFANNRVIIDGKAVRILFERGLGNLLGIERIRPREAEIDVQSYEQAVKGEIYGIKRFRTTCRYDAGDFVDITYSEGSEKEVLTEIYDFYGKKMALGTVRTKNALVIPFEFTRHILAQFSELKRVILSDFVFERGDEILSTETAGISPYLFEGNGFEVLMKINSTLEDLEEITIRINGEISEIKAIAKDGKIEPVDFKKSGDRLIIRRKAGFYSSETFIIKR
ncbi:MAG: hypothetical protein IJ800_00110 [Clostridia bacterium]|nr:hypothetical protein [Clostridia bacterium]